MSRVGRRFVGCDAEVVGLVDVDHGQAKQVVDDVDLSAATGEPAASNAHLNEKKVRRTVAWLRGCPGMVC